MKRTIRLTESELKRIISESVRKILKENIDNPSFQELEIMIENLLDQYQTNIDDYDIEVNGNVLKVKIVKKRDDGYMKYSDSTLFKFENVEENLYRYVITRCTGTRGTCHSRGYGYSNNNKQYVIKGKDIPKIVKREIEESIKWTGW